jgi:hypothetical protein
MDKKPLIGISICAVILLVLASLTNVVGYQAVQSSNPHPSNSECGCEKESGTARWHFPILCAILYAIILKIESMPWPWPPFTILLTIGLIGSILGCDWAPELLGRYQ